MIRGLASKGRFAGLGFRLMAVMGIALLPLTVLSYVQGLQGARLSEGQAINAIMGETLVAAAPLVAEVVKAQGKAATLAAAMPLILQADAGADFGACRKVMDDLVADSAGLLVFAGYIRRDGEMICGTGGQTRSFAANPKLAEMFDAPRPRMQVNPNAPVSKTSVLIFSHPVLDGQGRVIGLVVLSMPHSTLELQAPPVSGDPVPISLISFDAGGAVLTSSNGMNAVPDSLPEGRPLATFPGHGGESFVAQTQTGQRRAFAVVPIQQGTLYLMGSWPADRLDNRFFDAALPAFVFPTIMWAASLLVAYLAAEGQVLRHVRSLRDSITGFASEPRRLTPLDMTGAAQELQSVGRAYDRMTEAVVHNEADLENTIHQKEVLLREVHHRVKNNLQLIASIINMQLRGARSDDARAAMRRVQDRVISLATVHRELYQTSGVTDVRANELIPRVAQDLLRLGSLPERRFDLDIAVDDIHLTPDQAVPLALFLTEGMANAMKHAWGGATARSAITLRLTQSQDGMAQFSLRNQLVPSASGAADLWVDGGDGFGAQLLMAFAQQLNGTITRGRRGGDYVLSLEFPLCPLADAEERRSTDTPA